MSSTVALPRSTPEAQGMPSSAMQAFLDAAERDVQHLHSVMMLRHGHVVAEGWWTPYGRDDPHMLFSLSKSFTSTAIGLLVAEGRLSIDDTVLSHFPAAAPPEPSPFLRAMRVRHLLSMSTGHAADTTRAVFDRAAPDWTRAFLAQPVEFEPGTHFVYNTAATYMLAAIVQILSGVTLVEYLQPRLFAPLGIAAPSWEVSPEGINLGGTGLSLTTEDIARFGQLYLQRGEWRGARLIPEAWVAEATAFQVPNAPSGNPDWAQGYGYQFWRCRHDAYRGDGAFGQFCVVLPAQDAVLAITSGVRNMQQVLNLAWEHLLPAMGAVPLPENPPAQVALSKRLATLRLPPVEGQPTTARAADISGRIYSVAENTEKIEAISLRLDGDHWALSMRNAEGEQTIPCGHGRWLRGHAALERQTPWKVAASGAWTDERTYVSQLWWYETPFGRTLTCRFEGDRVTVEQQANVSFGPVERATLKGRVAGD
jgi:CubicO group peptidase (beta-lactamase class C family)